MQNTGDKLMPLVQQKVPAHEHALDDPSMTMRKILFANNRVYDFEQGAFVDNQPQFRMKLKVNFTPDDVLRRPHGEGCV